VTNFERRAFDEQEFRAPVAQPSAEVAEAAAERLANIAPIALSGPGALNQMAAWIAATQNQVPPRQLINVRLVIFAGDYALSSAPAMSSGTEVRAALAERLDVNSLAAAHGVTVRVLVMGVDDDFADLLVAERTTLQAYKIRRSTGAIDIEDGLTRYEVHMALAAGEAVAHEEVAKGAQLLICGDLGIADTTPAAALVAAAIRLPAADVVTGRHAAKDDILRKQMTALIDRALTRTGERATDPIEALAALGTADMAARAGFLVTAARCGVPALIDGVNASAAALLADRIAPGAAAWFAATHQATESAHSAALSALGLTPPINVEVRHQGGAGSVAGVPLIRSAAALLIQSTQLSDLDADGLDEDPTTI
jgi:nicotinate-nucleotide--dimethylbenzimidazole phosphoribosyltransferase